jgi:hypothetical protein
MQSYSVLERLPTSHYRLPPITGLQIVSGKVIYRTVASLVPQQNHGQASPSSRTLLSSPPPVARSPHPAASRASPPTKMGRQPRGPGFRSCFGLGLHKNDVSIERTEARDPALKDGRVVAARPFLPASIIHGRQLDEIDPQETT